MVKPPPAVRMLGASGLLAVSSSGCTRSRKISEASLILSSLIATESLKLRDNLVEAGMVMDTVCWRKSLVAVRWRDGNFLSDKAKYRTIFIYYCSNSCRQSQLTLCSISSFSSVSNGVWNHHSCLCLVLLKGVGGDR